MTPSLTTTAGRPTTATTGADPTSTPATDAYPLPGGAEVIRACGAEPPAGSDPILIAVSVLARKHLERIQAVPAQRDLYDNDHVLAAAARILLSCASAREALVDQIDRWVTERLPTGPPAALLHTETLGQLVDRMAMTWAYRRQLTHRVPSSRGASVGHQAQATMDEVAALVNAYDDLLAELRTGRRRLPTTVSAVLGL
ncbi:DUF4254 domain-containing protein [Saccharothrix sp. NRRL B-16348]|uniref:DUF4254 domain-containing protein n=1 Tax=Saccharothrix sp. NRRL B-16348 TaxID=1415542 RepID=UPI0006AF5E3D|nr:DUF4254 domain-containing protein [Saccharothrix sp. NRRL B-16348]